MVFFHTYNVHPYQDKRVDYFLRKKKEPNGLVGGLLFLPVWFSLPLITSRVNFSIWLIVFYHVGIYFATFFVKFRQKVSGGLVP